ncbi:MAG: UDP-3-O-(3-hydroxymyristoyl)glucosamine N-acyltransferase [Pseudomonadota bacterium]
MHPKPPTLTLKELANQLDRPFRGDPDLPLSGCATLSRAGEGDLSFLANPRYRSDLQDCQAGAVILREEDGEGYSRGVIISPDPYLDYARGAANFDPSGHFVPGVHQSSVVGENVTLGEGCWIGANSVLEPGVTIGRNVFIGAGCVVGPGCVIGDNSRLTAQVTLVSRVKLGQRVIIHPGAVLGADGFGLARDASGWVKVPQLGGVELGDDCEIGANTTIDCGALDNTTLENDVRLDNQIQVGHNVFIGAHTAIAGCVAIAGSARIGRNCMVAGGAGFAGHIKVADGVTVTAMTMVTHDIKEPGGTYSSGIPFQPASTWRRNVARLRNLDQLARRLLKLEKDSQ